MKRVAVLVLAMAAFASSPALAHGSGGGGSEGSGVFVPLLVGGFAVAAGALALRAKLPTAVLWTAVALGVALSLGSLFIEGGDAGRPDVHLAVTHPADGATIAAGKPIIVRVNVDGPIATGPQDTDGGHLHLSVDGQLQQMPYAATAEVTLEPGPHTLSVEYVDNQHLSYDPPIQDAVEVIAS